MKITSKTHNVVVDLYDYCSEATVHYFPSSSDPVARVIVFPEVWRANGKKYKVTDCRYDHNGSFDWDDKVLIRIPREASHIA